MAIQSGWTGAGHYESFFSMLYGRYCFYYYSNFFFRGKNQWGKNDIKGKFMPEFKIYCGCSKKSIFFRVQTEFVSLHRVEKCLRKKFQSICLNCFCSWHWLCNTFIFIPQSIPLHSYAVFYSKKLNFKWI